MCVLLYVAMAMGVTSCCHLPLCQHSPQDSSLSYDLKVSFTNLIREHTYTQTNTLMHTCVYAHTKRTNAQSCGTRHHGLKESAVV